jgi:hypothetical protein
MIQSNDYKSDRGTKKSSQTPRYEVRNPFRTKARWDRLVSLREL